MFTLEELELIHKLVDRHTSDKSWAGLPFPDVYDLREKIQGMICLRTLEEGEDYKFVARVGDVNIVSRR